MPGRGPTGSGRLGHAGSFLASDRTYGARRVWLDLLADRVSSDRHRIERLMQQEVFVDRTFNTSSANRKWVADSTYLWTDECWQ